MSAEKLLVAKNLVKIYKRGRSENIRAIDNVSLEIHPAEMVFLYGPSGSGKSTLLQLLSGMDKPTEGTIEYKNEDITQWDDKQLTKYRMTEVGFVFQSWELIDHLTALENVESPLYPTKTPSGELKTKAIQLLRKMELLDREEHYPKELSGGEQQRVSLARALIKEPKIIFADEPTGNLDSETGEMIMRMLKIVCRQGTAVIIATHNETLRKYADRTIKLFDGKMARK